MAPVGIWGMPTSTVDWCEDNYAVTPFIAEFWNTVSSIVFVVPAAVTLAWLIRENLEWRHLAACISLLCVGLGSWLFHMTLLYNMQLLDEIPMVWGIAIELFNYIELGTSPKQNTSPHAMALFLSCLIFTLVYIWNPHYLIFLVCFMSLVVLETFYKVKTFITMQCSGLLFAVSVAAFLPGAIAWFIDTLLCSKLSDFRANGLSPGLSPLSQLHGWWHIFSGVAFYCSLLLTIHTRCLVLNRRPTIKVGKTIHWRGETIDILHRKRNVYINPFTALARKHDPICKQFGSRRDAD